MLRLKILLLLSFFVLGFESFGQYTYGSNKEVEGLIGARLIVEMADLEELDQKKIDKLERKGSQEELQGYKDEIASVNERIVRHNELLQKFVKNYWIFNDEFEFMTESEVSDRAASDDYILALRPLQYPKNYVPLYSLAIQLNNGKRYKYQAVAFVNVPGDVQEVDVIYGLRLLQEYLNQRKVGGNKRPDGKVPYADYAKLNHQRLSKKTLLIDERILDKDLKAEAIKQYYPFPYKVVDQATIAEAVLNHDKDYAYIQLAPWILSSSQNGSTLMPAHHLVDCEDGKLIGYSKMKNTSFGKNPLDNMKVNKGTLKQYVTL